MTALPRLSRRIATISHTNPSSECGIGREADDLLDGDDEARLRNLQYTIVTGESDDLAAARGRLDRWDAEIKARELARARRIAPGFLDTGVTMLVPQSSGRQTMPPRGGEDAGGQRGQGRDDGSGVMGGQGSSGTSADMLAGLHF